MMSRPVLCTGTQHWDSSAGDRTLGWCSCIQSIITGRFQEIDGRGGVYTPEVIYLAPSMLIKPPSIFNVDSSRFARSSSSKHSGLLTPSI